MAVGADRLADLVRSLASTDPASREAACGTVTDWISSFSKYEARLVGMLLVTLAGAEKAGPTRESELHALYELADTGGIDGEVVGPIRLLDRGLLGVSELEYVKYLGEEYLGMSIDTTPSD
ncbi:MAG TPA: hypothetical protein VJT31_11385 [Rugosimonospora sp.]|nr:hypothetical protein [Rugosimonospora sp.]